MKGMLRNPFTTMSFLLCSQFQLLLMYLRFCNLISLSVNTSTVLSGKLYQIQSEDHFMLYYGTEHSHSCIVLKLMMPNLWHSGQDTRGKRGLMCFVVSMIECSRLTVFLFHVHYSKLMLHFHLFVLQKFISI